MIVFTSLVRQTRDAPVVGISELAGSGDVLVLAPIRTRKASRWVGRSRPLLQLAAGSMSPS